MENVDNNKNPRIKDKQIIYSDGIDGPKTIEVFEPEPLLYAKMIFGICRLLSMQMEELKANSKPIDVLNTCCYINPK